MSSASPAPLSSEPSHELLGPASPGSPVPAKRILDRWRQKVYSTASGMKDEFDRFIYISNLKSSNGLVLTILRRAHRLGLDNKRPYSGGLNRRSERISPSTVWLLTYSASPPCLRKQSESSQAQNDRLDGIEVGCLPKW
ncbi:uncharacterized protein FPOAC1_013722 [Fusarium poae]|uniref:uncharacterized protein n=1 Tax=Fusarium poae TaxID=36050 RepID=UPI001D04DA4C|nr:uncharacterized protein FPOAC1_013722 [Fusarium poae]KAG8664384.1 hypothetical protein FPOAC1_013722 [Fusarium poae]